LPPKDGNRSMMLTITARKPAHLSETQEMTRDAGQLMSRTIWLPRALYVAIPYFYIVAGIGALLAALYISDWFWILPHYLLFAAACLHMGILVYRKRHRP
jgi:hypothetical protein